MDLDKEKLKIYIGGWLSANMNDGDPELKVCTLTNYNLDEMYSDICEAIDDYKQD